MLLLALCLLMGWLLLIAVAYRTAMPAEREALPPERLLAIVEAVESAAPDPTPVMAALSAPGLRLELNGPLEPGLEPLPQPLLAPYSDRLAPRDVTAGWEPLLGLGRVLGRPFVEKLPERTVFRVTLLDGGTLQVAEADLLQSSAAGLPVGLAAGWLGTAVAAALLLFLILEARPVAQLARAVEDLAPGQIAPLPAPRRGSREVRELIAAFDRMQHRLAGVLSSRSVLLSGSRHDVRSFATRLRLRLDMIPDAAERARAEADIDEMILLLDDALLLGRAETRTMTGELLRPGEIAADLAREWTRAGQEVRFSGDRRAAILGDTLAMRRVLQNGIDNAVRYAGPVRLSVQVEGNAVVVSLDDDGPGIPAQDRDRLLEPFTRLETSRNRATGGAGLGLAIMRQLVEAQGGTLDLAASASGGTRVVARFPRIDTGG